MKIYNDEDLRYYAFRSGPAADHAALLTCEELDSVEQDLILQDADGEGYSASYISDLFAYDFDYVLQMLGYKQDPQTCDILRGDDCVWRFHVTDIVWDTDDEKVDGLPTEAYVDVEGYNDQEEDDAVDEVADILSDNYNFCVETLNVENSKRIYEWEETK